MHTDVAHLEEDLLARVEARLDEVLDDLVLRVDRDRTPAGEPAEIDAMAAPAEAQLDAVMDEAFALEPLAHARLDQEVDGSLLEEARADALLHVLAAVEFEHGRADALQVQQVRQQQPRRPGPDDCNLDSCFGLHRFHPPLLSAILT